MTTLSQRWGTPEGAEVEERVVLVSDVVCSRTRRREMVRVWRRNGGRVERVGKEREEGLTVALDSLTRQATLDELRWELRMDLRWGWHSQQLPVRGY